MKRLTAVVALCALGVFIQPALADVKDRPYDRGDRIENRLDRRGDGVDRHLDRKGERIDRRFDRRSDFAAGKGHEQRSEQLDRKGDRIERHLDRQGNRADRRLDHRGEVIDRRFDRREQFAPRGPRQ